MIRRTLPLTPLMLALAAALPLAVPAAEQGPGPDAGQAAGTQMAAADAAYGQAVAAFRDARFAEASAKVDEALRLMPSHAQALALRKDVQAVLGQRDDRLEMAATWFKSIQDVQMQETAIRIRALVESGDRKFAGGDYAGAELDYDRAEVSLRAVPYRFDWGGLPAQIGGKRAEARASARKQSIDRDAQARDLAQARAKEQNELQEQALKAKVDELLRRAQEAYGRKDYRRAEVDSWNAYELDRRREDARDLYLKSRREGHVFFDQRYEDERLERLARLNEEIYRSMIPQSEVLVYPEDWQRRSLRKPREIGSKKEEPWLAQLRDKLEQRVTFEFTEAPFEDVIAFLRSVTQVNIVVAPSVIAKAGGGTVTLRVKDMRFGDALKWVLQITSLRMALQDQAIFISDQPIAGAVVLRMYDVGDIISVRKNFPGRELAFSSAGGGGASGSLFTAPAATDDANQAISVDDLVELIKKNVDAQSWDGNTQVGIEQRAGSTLFITHTPEIQDQINELLTNLRNQDALQVKIDMRLLNVRKNYFEEIGFDWIAQNAGQPVLFGIPPGGSGYMRENSNSQILGNVTNTQALPANAVNFSQAQGGVTRGLLLQGVNNFGNFLSSDQISVIFSAVENESDLQQVSRPQITCFNGQQANASFITQFAYIKSYEVVSQNLDPKMEVLVFGDLIDIKPVVSSDRKYVMMEVKPTSVDLVGVFTEQIVAPRVVGTGGTTGGVVLPPIFTYPLELPNFEVKGLRSTVMLPDKGSLLLGGFQSSVRQRTHTGIPFLSHIPFLGRLFSRNGSYDDNRKLYYLLGAEIIHLKEKEDLQ
jgi:type II secretory pathway component GspD/PulD (secretin)